MAISTEEIIEIMMETIAECDAVIQSQANRKRDVEITLISSGFRIVQVETDEEALAWVR